MHILTARPSHSRHSEQRCMPWHGAGRGTLEYRICILAPHGHVVFLLLVVLFLLLVVFHAFLCVSVHGACGSTAHTSTNQFIPICKVHMVGVLRRGLPRHVTSRGPHVVHSDCEFQPHNVRVDIAQRTKHLWWFVGGSCRW